MNINLKSSKENIFYIVAIASIVLLLFLLFSSKGYMADDSPNNQTPFNTMLTGLDQSEVYLNKWEYNKKEKSMEVLLKIEHVGADAVKPTFEFKARTRENSDDLPIKISYQDNENIMLQINEIPEKYEAIAVYINEKRNRKMIEYSLNQTINSPEEIEEALENYKGKEIRVVGDYREIVTVNDSFKTRTNEDYTVEIIEIEIGNLNKSIRDYNKKIKMEEEVKDALKVDITELKESKKYQTEEEIEETNQRIKQKESEIEDINKKQIEYRTEIENIEQTIGKRKDKIKSIEEK